MSAESGTDKAVRREKIVMALGIIAVFLFSANLLTMIARHVWPDFRFESLFVEGFDPAVTGVETMETTYDHAVHVYVNRWKHHDGEHRFMIRMNDHDLRLDAREAFRETADHVEADLRAEMERLSRDITRQQRRMEADMNIRQDARLNTLRRARINLARVQSQAEETAATELVERDPESGISAMNRPSDVRETNPDGSRN